MKQHITKEQWLELGEENREDLVENEIFNSLLPSIGEMIEFLGELDIQNPIEVMTGTIVSIDGWRVVKYFDDGSNGWEKEELCDALWEAVKHKLK
jgi:hypothetical protein